MSIRGLLLLALAVLLGSVGVVYAAPQAQTEAVGPSVGSAAPAMMPEALRHNPTRAELRGLKQGALGGQAKDWSLNQSLWTGLIDSFEEDTEPSFYRGWVLNQDLNRDLFGEYKWGISDCRASHGRKSLRAIGDGAGGRLLSCNSPYPNGVNSSIWLSLDLTHWVTGTQQLDLVADFWLNLRTQVEGSVEPDGLFVSYMLPTTVGEEPLEHVVLAAVTANNPNSFWYQPLVVNLLHAEEVYDPDNDGVKRVFNLMGKKDVYIEFLFVSGQKTTERYQDGVYIDNVRLVSDVPGPNVTPPPVTPVTPATPTPTIEGPTARPTTPSPGTTEPPTEPPTATTPGSPTATDEPQGDWWIYLPIALKNASPGAGVPETPGPEPTNSSLPPSPEPPSPEPTDVPSATPQPTALPAGCREMLVNGGFEQGPSVGWTLESNAQKPDGTPLGVADVILNNAAFPSVSPPPAVEGEWFAFLGRGQNINMALYQTNPAALIEPQRVLTATLRYYLAFISDEVRDGTDDDVFGVFAMNESDEKVQVGYGISEESQDIVPSMIYEITADMTEAVKRRAGWDTMRLLFVSQQNDVRVSSQLLDGTSVVVCESTTPLVAPARRAVARSGAEAMTLRPVGPATRVVRSLR
jgi:hypothetical protein